MTTVELDILSDNLSELDTAGPAVVTHGSGLGANNHYPITGKQAKDRCTLDL